MRVLLLTTALVGALLSPVWGDIYLHVPRGSNNRLHEETAERDNAARLFDSQNNNRGGYNVGDSEAESSKGNQEKQYNMKYFMSGATAGGGDTYLHVEWTNQHGAGGDEDTDPHKLNANFVLQYMCQPDADTATGAADDRHVTLRNGGGRATQPFTAPAAGETESATATRREQVDIRKGLHEDWDSYNSCHLRERNNGLFTADQELDDNALGYSSAIYTRQNSGGQRRGYECPEERDYYPYWHPTAWKDIAVLAANVSHCSAYTRHSFNVRPYHRCVEWWDSGSTRSKASRHNNQADCEATGGAWALFSNYLEKAQQYSSSAQCNAASVPGARHLWAVPHDSTDGRTQECLVSLRAPDCLPTPWSRVNHLGNGRDGAPNTYKWRLPYFPSQQPQRCVMRMRYNISSDDYAPWRTDARHNGAASPVQNNPLVAVADGGSPLRLAINTAQFGRTFQDRSHVFLLRPRPDGVEKEDIYNLNVRGKRGNIVQVYPAVEYDFAPNHLTLGRDDLVHIQWTGSNTHNNGAPGGDGATGNDGEGTAGTDRSNLLQLAELGQNYPLPYESTTMWESAQIRWIHHGQTGVKPEDLAIDMASSGYYMCVESVGCPEPSESAQTKTSMNRQLNTSPASYEGALLNFRPGTYYYLSTRNNNFSNRSQKGAISVR